MEIKFRAWRPRQKEMIEVDVLAIGSVGWDCETYNGVSLAYQPDTKVMQYVNVRDKNTIEIYEGDIVKAFGSMWTVEYRENDSAFRLVKHNETKSIRSLHSSSYEVIGNVYENPELMEGN